MQGSYIRIKEKRPDIEMIADIETITDKNIIETEIIIELLKKMKDQKLIYLYFY